MPQTNTITPRHVAIIMDGNGRWAKERGKARIEGHKAGAKTIDTVLKAAIKEGVEFLTLYAFSSENWNRPKNEVAGLMNLLVLSIKQYEPELVENKIRFRTIGDISKLPAECVEALDSIKAKTRNFEGRNIVLALNYGSRDETVRAVRAIAKKVSAGNLDPQKIDWATIAQNLDTSDIPDPDLIIRTSGEMRLSNYLMLQGAYAELYFTETYWPDFSETDFKKALDEFRKRERRYGLTGEQVK